MIVTIFYNRDEQEKLWNPDDDFLSQCGVLSSSVRSRKPKMRVLPKSVILCRFNKMVKNERWSPKMKKNIVEKNRHYKSEDDNRTTDLNHCKW